MLPRLPRTAVAACFMLLALGPRADASQDPQEERRLEELRNTIGNLLQALVERGVITREQAQAMVKAAEDKAAADAAAVAEQRKQQAKEEEGAVRVPYVPQIVKEEIRKEVASDVAPSIKKEVSEQLGSNGTLFSALPEWVQRMKWSGDARIRGEGDNFASSNATNSYLDFNNINSAGGIDKAGTNAFLNTTEDRDRLRLRLRAGFTTDLGNGFATGMRIATGAGEIFLTTNQTLGNYDQKYQIALDEGFVSWTGTSSTGRQILTLLGGRFSNPYVHTDLGWYNDLTFEGLAGSYRLNLSHDNTARKEVFLTMGGYPVSNSSPLNPNDTLRDKWLIAPQLGTNLRFAGGSELAIAGAYYDYRNIVGQRNAPASTLLNWTAPALVQKGNTMFDISNSTDPTVNLFALASDFREVDVIAHGRLVFLSKYAVGMTLEGVKNIGFDSTAVFNRTGTYVAPRNRGYLGDLEFGTRDFGPRGTWTGAIGYRYLERDAVIDAFNDEDFHLGGTDAKGYTLRFDYSINPRVFVRLKYMSANEIDGPPLAIDVIQVDFNTRF